jgi:two-component system cell cycle sensor histidine kinase/response regulator CckA
MRKAVLLIQDKKIQQELSPLLGRCYRLSIGKLGAQAEADFDLCVLDRGAFKQLLAKAGTQPASREELERLADFSRFNPNPVFEVAPDGKLLFANDAAHQLAALVGMTVSAMLPSECVAIVQECLATGRSKLCVETRLGLCTISWSFFPSTDRHAVHCYAGDITERLNLEAQLRQSQKLEAIGQLAGGVAHDFNNMLTAILGYSNLLLLSEAALPPNAGDALRQIVNSAERAAGLTRQLLAFSRKQSMRPEPLDLNALIGNLAKMLRRIIGEDIKLNLGYSAQLPPILGDAGALEQVLLNLVVNARDSMSQGGQLTISTSFASLGAEQRQTHPEARAGEFVRLSVTDTGCGIPAEILSRIFEPFFTTKEAGKGTGLGLATVRGIVQQHQGWIEVESYEGVGSNFIVYLPARPDLKAAVRPGAQVPLVEGRGETVLLVEDEAAVRQVTRTALEQCRYRVLEASSGLTAREAWRSQAGNIDLLLSDVVMPDGLSGRALAEELRAEKPGLKVLLVSGYGLEKVDGTWANRMGIRCLQKPFVLHALARAVRDCLDGRALGPLAQPQDSQSLGGA